MLSVELVMMILMAAAVNMFYTGHYWAGGHLECVRRGVASGA